MAFSWTPGGDVSTGGQWLDQPGWYHFLITEVQEPALNKDNVPIPNAAFKLGLEVLAGNVEGQKGKTSDQTFFHPKVSDKNEGAFARKKIDRLFLATGLMTAEEIAAKTPKPDLDIQGMNGRQVIMHLDKEKEDSKFLSLSFADIYHVDDPAVAAYPKCQESLALIDEKLRWIGGAKGKAVAAAASNGNGAKPAAMPAPLKADPSHGAESVLETI